MSKIIYLTKGQHTVVDDDDYDFLSRWKWYTDRDGYAKRTGIIKDHEGRTKFNVTIPLPNMIMTPPNGKIVDHINGDKLDNRRANLRICSIYQNNSNSVKCYGKRTSKYKGVSFDPTRGTWRAQIQHRGKPKFLGRFVTENEAAAAYNHAALICFGEFARINDVK
jgi:hypothetical protein